MRGFVVAIVLLLASAVHAGEWRHLGNNFFAFYDGGVHDGWYYTRTLTSGCYQYARHSRIPMQSYGVNYSANWKSDLVKALDRAKDNELFLRAIKESGLQTTGYGGYGGYGGASSGITYSSYGHQVTQGNTLYGLAAYSSGYGQTDVNSLLHNLGRLAEKQADNMNRLNNVFSDRIGQVSEAQLEIARIQEGGRILTELMKAAAVPRTEVTQWQQRVESGEQQQQEPSRDDTALALVRVHDIFTNKCVKCHGPLEKKGGLDLSGFSSWEQATDDAYARKIKERVWTDEPGAKMPPPDHPQLTADELQHLKRLFP